MISSTAVEFDFVRRPELEYKVGTKSLEDSEAEHALIRIKALKSEAAVLGPLGRLGNREALAMVMLDYDSITSLTYLRTMKSSMQKRSRRQNGLSTSL